MQASTPSGFDFFGVDAVTIEMAVLTTFMVFVIRRRRKIAVEDMRAQIIIDFLNGSVIFPFIALFFAVFQKSEVVSFQGSKFSIALASAVGLVFVVGELVKSCTKQVITVPEPEA